MRHRATSWIVGAIAAATAGAAADADQVVLDDSGFAYVIEGASLAEGDGAGSSGGVALSSANLHSALVGNRVEEAPGDRGATIDGSLKGNAGVVNLNQDAGEVNNQANLRGFAIGGAVQNLDISGGVELRANTLVAAGGARHDLLNDSLSGTAGVVGVNQTAGALNQQANAFLLAVGASLGGDVLTLSDSTLGRVAAENLREGEGGGPRSDTIAGGFQGFRGVAQITQAAGDLNVVNNMLAVSVVAVALPTVAP